jgi:tetratricopeptide (TPR) repeat protein
MGLGERIRQLRQSRGLTQEQLADGKLTKSFISLLERGTTRPSVNTLLLLAHRLGTSVDALLGSEGHLPAHAAVNLLALSAKAMRERRMDLAAKVLAAARVVAESYSLEEPLREVALQEAQRALEERNYEFAARRVSEGLQLCAPAQDRWRRGRALVLQGRLHLIRRELHEAVTKFEQALTTLRQAKASRDPARSEALIFLGTALAYLGKHDLAMRRYAEAAEAQATRDDPVLRGRAAWGLGLACRRLGDLDRAAKCLNQAREAFEATEELPDLARVLHNLGQLQYEQRRYGEALHHLTHALRVTEQLNLKITRASTLTEIARVHLATNNLEDAAAIAEQAIEAAQDAPDAVEVAEAKTVLAAACAMDGRVDRAKELMAEAVAAFRSHGAHERIVQAARDLGEIFMRRGAKADAADQMAIALETEDTLRNRAQS